ncbi:MAG: hypothetical protein HZA61_15385 [Candidatus Eisenbacteria bacterium]|uniref:Uncharacterized protein n=1 Tax=Eiseniibacteriota bacterium TaxID=2212470 RepID=A0A933SGG0_UNCEI|nr:hypothetical protein [Candidatus Eisenbacteria bacterium]
MTRPEFERTMAGIRARIAELPEDERAALEALAAETVERHEDISRNALRSTRALERLELAFERMDTACRRLAVLAEEAREALVRARSPRQDAPGLN